jgi:hypothetical protein
MTTYAPALSGADHSPLTVQKARGRTLIVAATLVLAAGVVAIVLLFRPWPLRNSFLYQELAPVRDAIWTAILIDAVAFGAIGLSFSLGVCLLAPARGARLANLGAVVTTTGGLLFAMGAFAFAAFTWYVTDPTVLSVEDGTRVLGFAVASPEHLMLAQMVGFLLYTLGSLILAAALFRSGAVTRWLPIAIVGTTLAQFLVHDRVLDFVQVGAMALLVVVGVQLARGSTGTSTGAVQEDPPPILEPAGS